MASTEAFVDVTYRGLDAGRRLKLTDLGPETGYLEMARPLPVGARLALTTDEGCEIAAVIVRVHEQVAGAELPPGVRVRVVDPAGEAATWWSARVTQTDPVIPTPPPPPKAVPLPIDTVGVPPDWEPPAAEAKADAVAEPDVAESSGEAQASPDEAVAAPEKPAETESPAEAAAEPEKSAASEPSAEGEAADSTSANGERKKRKRGRRRRR
jgi:hypothetical protein